MDNPIPSLADGLGVIRRYLAELPAAPGVYRMIDLQGNALYIGKAKHLRNRVSNYTNASALNTRLQRMVSQTVAMEFTHTRSEAEALLLEANLIKKLSPRYNVLLKDDKSFPYIFFSGEGDFPRIEKHRGAKTKKGKYFGPFVSGWAVNETITFLQKAFLLRPCADTIFKNRTRPCLQYQIKRCSAPCVNKIGKEQYQALAQQAYDFLSGKSKQVQESLIAEMQELSLKMDYEKASIIRDRLKALNSVQQQHGIGTASIGDADVIAMVRGGKECCVTIFSYRAGRNYGNRSYFPAHTAQASDSEIVSTFIGQYYQTQPIPPTILISHMVEESSLLEEALMLNCDHKVEIIQPLRGEKRAIVEQAQANAKEALMRNVSLHASGRTVLLGMQKLFGLEELPSRIEVYDNSHISGTDAVGAMIVAGQQGFLKNEYRKFNITNINPRRPKEFPTSPSPFQGEGLGEGSLTELERSMRGENPHPNLLTGREKGLERKDEIRGGDDYAMLREVLTRRFKRLQEEDGQGKRPDLVLIDGGAGQLSVATQVFEELGISGITYVGIAKGPDRNAGREQFFMPGREPFMLPENDPVLHSLQRLRDEAHRFAIGTHRNKRSKSMQTSELDAVPGIGASRKKALLLHFGSAREVSSASLEEIAKVEGISHATAKLIYAHFHGEG